MTPENNLVLLFARSSFPREVRDRTLALMSTALGWDAILDRVVAEEVYPLFYRNLRAIREEPDYRRSEVRGQKSDVRRQRSVGDGQSAPSVDSVGASIALTPNATNAINASNQRSEVGDQKSAIGRSSVVGLRSVFDQLQKLSRINAFRNTLLVEELIRVLKRLSDAGIPAIPLKGSALAQRLYGDPSLRVCVDLDILVPRSMVRRAFDLLRADGYASEFGPGFFADLLFRHDIEYALRRQARGLELMVELHWGVSWGGKLEESVTDRLWADAYPTTVFGAPAYALSSEWQMLFLAAHAARHQWQGLKWLVDLHELYSSPDVDWDKLDQKGKQLGWEELLRISFLACHQLFDTAIPVKYLTGELPSWVKLFPDSVRRISAAPFSRPVFSSVRSTSCAMSPACFWFRHWPNGASSASRSFLRFLYYPLRPLRLGWRWVLGIRC